jgi:hypothetical protein
LLLLLLLVLLRLRLLLGQSLGHWTTRYLKRLGVEHRLRTRLRIALGLMLGLGLELGWRLVLWSVVGVFLRRALRGLRGCVGGLLVRVARLWFRSGKGVVPALLGLHLEPLLLVLVLLVAVEQVAAR